MGSRDLETMLSRIYAALDEHRFSDLPAFYAPAITAETPGGVVAGHEQLVDLARRNHEGVSALQHLVTGVIVDERGDDADLRANLVAVFATAQHEVEYEIGSLWRGDAKRGSDGWQITRFSITPLWQRGTRPV